MILDRKITVERLTTTVSGQEAYASHPGFTFVPMNIQPASAEFTQMADGQFFKVYKAFTLASGIVEGYRLTVSGTAEQYIVRGREAYGYGAGQHYELALERGTR